MFIKSYDRKFKYALITKYIYPELENLNIFTFSFSYPFSLNQTVTFEGTKKFLTFEAFVLKFAKKNFSYSLKRKCEKKE